MKTGIYISGIGHAVLIIWILVGDLFAGRPSEDVTVTEVSLVSAEEFALLNQPARAPSVATEITAPEPPQPDTAPPEPAIGTLPRPAPRPELPQPEAADPVPEPPAPETEVVVEDQTPAPITPPAETESALPQDSAPAPIPRVAPTPAPVPQPDAVIADEAAEATRPTPAPLPVAPPQDETTAPEAATDRIVTEADQTDEDVGTLTSSPRPRPRPPRPEPQPTPDPAPADTQTAANDAPATPTPDATQTAPGTGRAALGPPLTQGERDAFRLSVQQCWVVDVGSESGRIVVTVAFSMTEDGKVVGNSLKMIENSGGSDTAVRAAFESARRAVLRCQNGGYSLDPEKYEQWRNIEVTFDPANMRN